MTTATRSSRTDRASLTREAILIAAERLFAEHGVFAVSNRQVSEAAGQGNNAAVISLVYLHMDAAVARFQKVVAQFCHSPPPDPKSPPYA